MNPTILTITLPAAVTEWAETNNIDLAAYVRDVIGMHMESVVCATPPLAIRPALQALRAAVRPTVSRQA